MDNNNGYGENKEKFQMALKLLHTAFIAGAGAFIGAMAITTRMKRSSLNQESEMDLTPILDKLMGDQKKLSSTRLDGGGLAALTEDKLYVVDYHILPGPPKLLAVYAPIDRFKSLQNICDEHVMNITFHPDCDFCLKFEEQSGFKIFSQAFEKLLFDTSDWDKYSAQSELLEEGKTNPVHTLCLICGEETDGSPYCKKHQKHNKS